MKSFLAYVICTICCFGDFSYSEKSPTSDKNSYVISLGSNCIPALHLSHHRLRTFTSFFDWNVTPFESLISLIQNDYNDY